MAGLPVLTTPLDAVAELLERYDAGVMVPSPDPKIVAEAISVLLHDDERYARMRRNALAAAAADLRWDVERHCLTDLYARLIGERAAAPAEVRQPGGTQPRSR